jgi:predicted aconitase
MKLTDGEKAILDGKEGAERQAALDLLVRYGIAMGADRLLDVTNVAGGVANYYPRDMVAGVDPDNADFTFAVMHLGAPVKKAATMRIPCTAVNTCTLGGGCSLDYLTNVDAPPELVRSVELAVDFRRSHKFHSTQTCAPYLVGCLPMKGEHVAWGESSAVIFVNSAMGARTNCEGVQSSGAAAIVGKIPNAGLHLDENRLGTHLIRVEQVPQTPIEWDLMGYYCGKIVQEGIPVFIGDFGVVTLDSHKKFGSALATTGDVDLYHIVGRTPEAHTLEEAFGGRKPVAEFKYGKAEEDHAREVLDSSHKNKVDFALLGCPFYSIDQIRRVADLLEGKKLRDGAQLMILTAWMTKLLAQESGYAKTIEDAGGVISEGTCPPMVTLWPNGVTAMATDSAKMAHYGGANRNDLEIHLGDAEQCVRAVLTGNWI